MIICYLSSPPIVKKAGESSGYALELTADGSRVHFWVHTVNSGWVGSPSEVVPTGIWTHVAGVYDGTNVSLYVNGQLIGSTSATGNITPSNSELNIGRDPGFSTKLFRGLIDEVEILPRPDWRRNRCHIQRRQRRHLPALCPADFRTGFLVGWGQQCP